MITDTADCNIAKVKKAAVGTSAETSVSEPCVSAWLRH
jgi:hypothetical protein